MRDTGRIKQTAGRETVSHWFVFTRKIIMDYIGILSVFAAPPKPAVPSVTSSPGALKSSEKTEDGGKAEDSGLSPDQLVPDYSAGLVISSPSFVCQSTPPFMSLYITRDPSFLFGQQDETKNVPDGRPQTSLPSDNGE